MPGFHRALRGRVMDWPERSHAEQSVKKRWLVVSPVVLALAAGIAIWSHYLAPPTREALPLPEQLIAIDSVEGRRLLAESGHIADYPSLRTHFQPQVRRAYCGVASAVITLNALRPQAPRLDQGSFFHDAARDVRHPLHVSYSGMSLAQLGQLLAAHGADARTVHAADVDIATFRALALRNLSAPGDYVLVNYQREVLGQARMGHISPLAGYHAGSDRFLVLDVASHKYPPVWVDTRTLWNAMREPLAPGTSRTRGFVLVRDSGIPLRVTARR